MSSPPFLPLYVGDYLADTQHLTAGEDGAYLRLLMCLWRAGGTLPDDDVRLARFCKLTPAQWRRVKPAVMEFFDVSEGSISQGRLSAELQKYTVAVFQRREAGSRGGKAKALKDKGTSVAVAMLPPCQPEPEPEPYKNTLSLSGVIDLTGDALASMATHPGIASLASLNGLLVGGHPCDAEADIYPAIQVAAAWHRSKGGPGSMTGWTVARRIAIENRDRRLAGNPTPKDEDHDQPAGGARTPYSQRQRSGADALLSAAARVAARRDP